MEYVWGLHPFIPEHDDEIEFKGGERILVLEKDDVYQDGWWRGTNHMGKTGLFPKDYTTNVPPASVNVSTPSKLASAGALTSLQEDDEPESSPEDRDGKATMMNNLPSLASMDAKLVTPPSITPAPVSVDAPASAPDANGHQRTASGTVLHATMTDIQEAIEQLGVRQNADNASRSFSFASTREGLTTDEEDHRESEDRDFSDEHEFGWNKDARKLLAANASKQQAEAQSALDARLAALSQPPIEVEMSDESEDEDHHRSSDSHNTRRQSYEAAFAIQAATAEAVEAQRRLAEEIPSTPITARPGPYSLASTSGINGSASTNSSYSRHIRHDSDATTVGGGHGFSSQPRSTKVSESTVVGNPRHISSREQLASAVLSLPEAARTPAPPAVVDEAPVIAAATTSVFAAAQSTPLPMSSPATPAPPPTIDASVFPVPPLPTPTPYSVAATPKVLFPVAEEPPAIITPIPVAVVAPAPAPPVEPQIQIPASMASWSTPASPIMSSKPPSEWNVDEVVAWLRSKKFDEGICSKFIEHEISGDVLLELDMNMLKEVDITAFGKRMKLANAIAELRRPPSVASFNPPMSIAPSISANSQMYTQSPVILASGMPPLPYSPESAPHTGDLPGGPFGTIGFADARNGKARPASLALGPEDQVIAGKSMLTSTSGGSVVGDETETVSSQRDSQARARMGFGRSAGGSISSLHSLMNGTSATATTPPSATDPTRSRHMSKDSALTVSSSLSTPTTPVSMDDDKLSKKEKKEKKEKEKQKEKEKGIVATLRTSSSAEAGSGSRNSFFGGSLGKSRKPAPRYSETQETLDASANSKPGRSLSRLYMSSGSSGRRGRQSNSTPPSSGAYSEGSVSISAPEPTGGVRELAHASPISPSSDANGPTLNGASGLKPNVSVLEQIGKPDREGWMRKKGDRYNSWKLRYFMLKGPHLYYLRSKTETKIKGYINIKGYRIMADENANPGRYGFSIIHPTGTTHWFSSEEQIAIREWMKALMKATIGRDYTKPVMSSVNIPTIPLAVAQAMSPAPRPPSPTQRDATQRALRRDNPNQLSDRDAQVLMALPTTTAATATPSQPSLSPPTSPTLAGIPAPNRPARDSTRPDTKRRNMALEQAQDAELISWINKRIPNSSRKATNMTTSLATGLVLYRLAESLKTNGDSDKGIRGGVPNVPDSVFSDDPGDDKLDGLFVLFDFLLDNDVRIGNVTINDVRSGDRDQLVVLVKALRAWGEKRSSLDSIFASKQTAAFGPFIGSS